MSPLMRVILWLALPVALLAWMAAHGQTLLPTSPRGLPPGAMWDNGGMISTVPGPQSPTTGQTLGLVGHTDMPSATSPNGMTPSVTAKALPTSPKGLSPGSYWNNGGMVAIVPPKTAASTYPSHAQPITKGREAGARRHALFGDWKPGIGGSVG
jgi:hypothetical protein